MKNNGFLAMMAMMSITSMNMDRAVDRMLDDEYDEPVTPIITPLTPKKGQFMYWFRYNGTFLSDRHSERMLKDEVFFICFSINDKNALKKFNKYLYSRKRTDPTSVPLKFEDLSVGQIICDEDGDTGVIEEIENMYNVYINYGSNGKGICCFNACCNDKIYPAS